jgi:hypothetical protein
MLKKILIGVGALVVVVVAAVALLMSNLDSIVKTAIEEVGSKVAGVPVRVSAVKISLTEGRGTLQGLTVGNPAGFKTANAFALGEVTLGIDPASATANPVVVTEITVLAPQVTYELGEQGSNIEAIQKNVQAATGGAKGGKPAKADEPAAKDEKKLVIDKVLLKDGRLTLASGLTGTQSAALPEIRLANIGRKGGGATAAEVAGQILDAISAAAVRSATSLGVDKVLKGAGDAVRDAGGDAVKGGVDQVKGIFGK